MANGAVVGKYSYWRSKGEVNLKLCLQYETFIFLRVCVQDSNATVEFTVLLFYRGSLPIVAETRGLHKVVGQYSSFVRSVAVVYTHNECG